MYDNKYMTKSYILPEIAANLFEISHIFSRNSRSWPDPADVSGGQGGRWTR